MLREIAPEKVLRVDANEAWLTKEEALRRIETLARDPHIEFVEQPMPADRPSVGVHLAKGALAVAHSGR